LGQKTNRHQRILKVITEINAQTSIVEVINRYGAVIPLPISLEGRLPNFFKLMDPSTNWDGGNPVCQQISGENVYSTVSKLVLIVCWSCLHTHHDHEAHQETPLPFKFYWSDKEVSDFFGKERGEPEGEGRKYWQRIEKGGVAEDILRPQFLLSDKTTQEPIGLLDLLNVILDDIVTGNSWSRWDELLGHIPQVGLGALLSRSTAAIMNGPLGKREEKKYRDLASSLGYLSNDEDDDAVLERKRKRPKNEGTKERKRKVTPNARNVKEMSKDEGRLTVEFAGIARRTANATYRTSRIL
jgi:hypothetical protein